MKYKNKDQRQSKLSQQKKGQKKNQTIFADQRIEKLL